MKLEDQCCSIELAKRLKELGVKQESLFYWVERRGFGSEYGTDFGDPELRISPHHVSSLIALEPDRRPDGQFYRSFSAFTVAELGEMLPKGYYTWRNHGWCGSKKETELMETSETEADCRAKMIIHLIEKGTFKP